MFEYIKNGKIEKNSFENIINKQNTILYFYPKDDTSGCTIQANDFTSFKNEFKKLGYQIVGVSKDNIDSHDKFCKKYNLGITIISDPNLLLHKEFDVLGEKIMFGKKVNGTIRSIFILDNQGNIIKKYSNVKSKLHAEKLLKELKV